MAADAVTSQANAMGDFSSSLSSLLQTGLAGWQTVEQIKATKDANNVANLQALQATQTQAASSSSSGLPTWALYAAGGVAVLLLVVVVLKK